jgi:hypothetical protein
MGIIVKFSATHLQRQNIRNRASWYDLRSEGNSCIASFNLHKLELQVDQTSLTAAYKVEVGGFPENVVCLIPIQFPKPVVNPWVVVADHSDVALEEGVICCIKTNDAGEESKVCFSYVVSKEVRVMARLRQVCFQAIEAVENTMYGFVVRFLRFCKSCSVDAVVDHIVDPLVHLLDVGLQVGRKQASITLG